MSNPRDPRDIFSFRDVAPSTTHAATADIPTESARLVRAGDVISRRRQRACDEIFLDLPDAVLGNTESCPVKESQCW